MERCPFCQTDVPCTDVIALPPPEPQAASGGAPTRFNLLACFTDNGIFRGAENKAEALRSAVSSFRIGREQTVYVVDRTDAKHRAPE